MTEAINVRSESEIYRLEIMPGSEQGIPETTLMRYARAPRENPPTGFHHHLRRRAVDVLLESFGEESARKLPSSIRLSSKFGAILPAHDILME